MQYGTATIVTEENIGSVFIIKLSFFNTVNFLVVSWNDVIFRKSSTYKKSVSYS